MQALPFIDGMLQWFVDTVWYSLCLLLMQKYSLHKAYIGVVLHHIIMYCTVPNNIIISILSRGCGESSTLKEIKYGKLFVSGLISQGW